MAYGKDGDGDYRAGTACRRCGIAQTRVTIENRWKRRKKQLRLLVLR
jgi:hypothetical protein